MSEVATPPAPATAPAAPAAPAAAPAASAPATSPAPPPVESLIHGDPAAAPAAGAPAAPAPPASDDPFAALLQRVPEKFHVKQGERIDAAATLGKVADAFTHLEKRMGSGDVPPKNAAEYAFQAPEQFKDLQFNEERLNGFREGALKLGFTQEQYQFAMQMHLEAAPDLMESAAALTAQEARAELGKVWKTPTDMDTGIQNATRALRGLPAELQEATRELGTDPAFLQAMAFYGSQMREDRPPGGAQGAPSAPNIEALMKGEAYTNPKHPEHTRVSEQVRQHFARVHGSAPL
jgi:hypothetical protein